MTEKKDCRDCDYSGMDMDMDPFCVHPNVLKEHPYGLVLHSTTIAKFCPSPELPLFIPRKPRVPNGLG